MQNFNDDFSAKEVDWSQFEVTSKRSFRSLFRKRVICFIHGFTSSFATHDTIFKRFIKKGYRFFAFNLPAHGNSIFDFSHDDLTIENFAHLVVKFINFHKLKEVILVGHSMGGAIAAIVHSLIPEKIKCLILEDPLNKSVMNSKELVKFFLKRDYDGKFKILHPIRSYRESYKNNPNYKKILFDIFSIKTTRFIADAFEQIGACPTLLIFGENDEVIDPESSIRYVSRFATNLTIKIIANAGHSPSYDQPEDFFLIIHNFLLNLYSSKKNEKIVC